MIGIPHGTEDLFGVTWSKFISGHDFSEYDDNSKKTGEASTGLTVIAYENSQYGQMAFSVDAIQQINIEDNNKLLTKVKLKTDQNKPYIIYCNEDHKYLYSQWNNGNNTIILLKDFEIENRGKNGETL